MAISILNGYRVGSANAIDTRFVMTFAEMKEAKDSMMPIVYFTVCSDDGNFYIYKKSNTPDETTGKFRLHESGSGDPSIDLSKEEYQELIDNDEVQMGVTYYVYDESGSDIPANVIIQYQVMPSLDDIDENVIVLYSGETTTEFTTSRFYKCVIKDDGKTWEEVNLGGGSEGSVIPETFTTNVTVGGIESGTVIEEGTSVAEVIKNILLKYIKPTITLSMDPVTTLYYYGQNIPLEVLSVSVTPNNGKITKIEFKKGDTILNTIENEEGLISGSYTDDTVITDTVTYTILGSGTDDISTTKTITFCNPTFVGTVAADKTSVTADDITGLSKKFANNKKGYTYSGITMDFGKILYAYPKSFGALTTISDGTYSYTDSYTRSEVIVNINGTDIVYYAYLLIDATGVENFKQIYS